MHRTLFKVPLILLGLPLLLTACGTPNAPDAGTQPTPAATPHGYIDGAQENAEPQTGLLTLDRETGEANLLSLLTEETVDAGTFGPIDAVHQDGRYAFITGADSVEVFDTGAWTVPHGDHKHYYSTEPGAVGTIDIEDPGAIAGDGSTVTVFSDSGGYASLYSTKDLDAGQIKETGRITTSRHDGIVVPFEDHFLASVAAPDGEPDGTPDGVEVRNADDQTVLAKEGCPGLSGHAQTRVGVVFSCTDGALLLTGDDGAFTAEHIPYPSSTADPATNLEHRPGSNELAGPAGDVGVWHLDVSKRTWTLLETPVPVVAAAAVGDTQRVLAVGVDGSLLSLDPASGAVLHQAPLLDAGTNPQLRIDTTRAYVGDPNSSSVYEIDYADDLRVARTFEVPSADIMLETGL